MYKYYVSGNGFLGSIRYIEGHQSEGAFDIVKRLGLVAVLQQRVKEIGARRVCQASLIM